METNSNTKSSPPAGEWQNNVKHDLLASVVVFLVALPLCMGIAIASGVPVAAGLITGIVGGLVVGVLAGCPLQVSGPAAGLTVIVYDVVQQYGLEMLGAIVLIAGVIQVVAAILRLGQWFRAVSPAVIKGMLAGIGVLILASQFHVMVDDKPKGNGLRNLITIPQSLWKGLALPELSDRDVRQTRTDLLREFGELHRRQVSIHEQVVERTPRPASPSSNPLLEDPVLPERIEVADLANEQTAILKELEQATERMAKNEVQSANQERVARINQAALAALNANRAALAAIEENRVAALRTTHAAVESLENLLGEQKNHHLAAILGTLTILVIVLWQGLVPKRMRVIPAPLIAVVVATAAAAIMALPVLYVEIPDSLWKDIRYPSWTVVQSFSFTELFQAGLLLAVVASAETLLCATAVDQMQQGPRTRYDRELFAQGAGNMVCGFLGALPMTGVIVRSTANVMAGGRTRLSAILHGLWLLIFVAGLAFVLRLIPTASLAAILVFTGYKLVDLKSVRKLRQYGWGEVGIYAATVGTIVATDLLTGVLVGIGLAAAKLLYTFSHLTTELRLNPDRSQAQLRLHGTATFVRLPALASELENVPGGAELHVDFQHLNYIDHACLDLLMNWAKQHAATGGKLVIDWESLHARFHREPVMRNGLNPQPAAGRAELAATPEKS